MDDRRQKILDVALDCFVEKGYGAVGITDIKKRSGASVGSIYHFFGTKDGIAVTLFAEGLAAWAAASLAVPVEGSAEDIVKVSVRNTIQWALDNPKLYRFMEQTRFLEPLVDLREQTQIIVTAARSQGEDAIARLQRSGDILPLPWELTHALVLGPAYDWLRLHSAGLTTSASEEVIDLLARAAWNSVKVT